MPAPKRVRIEPTEDWTELQLRFHWPEQGGYELIRPVVLFGFTPAKRAQQTGIPVGGKFLEGTIDTENIGSRG
jgi:hypothetical protein